VFDDGRYADFEKNVWCEEFVRWHFMKDFIAYYKYRRYLKMLHFLTKFRDNISVHSFLH